LNPVLERNIQIIMQRRRQETESAGLQERIARAITQFAGSMGFIYLHAIVYGIWITANLATLPGIPRFDPTLVFLATEASVEAIFLSTFVLITQNRMSAAADRRADLDVQIGLLTEHEMTRLLALNSAIARQLGVKTEVDPELEELKRDIAPEAVMDKLEDADL
jgi:uncharacterized membrane protein